jgi:hypothetical protein
MGVKIMLGNAKTRAYRDTIVKDILFDKEGLS